MCNRGVHKYNEIETPAVKISAVKNRINYLNQNIGYMFIILFLFTFIMSLIFNSNAWMANLWMVCFAPIYSMLSLYIPQEIKMTPEGDAMLALGVDKAPTFVEELKDAVVRDATEEDLNPKGCTQRAPGQSWCESRTVETSIVIEGTRKGCCGSFKYFFTVPRSPELTALINGAVANKV